MRDLFVYGSLLAGEPNHVKLSGARLLGARATADAFELVDLGAYPALVPARRGRGRAIRGELYRVSPRLIAALDVFEGHPSLYERRRIALSNGESAFAYLMCRRRAAGLPRIEAASWREHQKKALAIGIPLLALLVASTSREALAQPQPPSDMTPWYRRVTVDGAVDVYDALNFNRPGDGRSFFSGVGTTASRANEIGLGLLSLGAHVKPDPVGLHLVLQAGPQATIIHQGEVNGEGVDPTLWRHVQRASIEARVDAAEGVELEAGVIPFPAGFEAMRSEQNWNYTRSYIADLSPYDMTGFRAKVLFTKHLSMTGALMNGWQRRADNNASKTFALQTAIDGDSGTLQLNAMAGRESEDDEDWRLWGNVTGKLPVGRWLTIAATADLAAEQRGDLSAARWWGVAGYVRFALTPGLAFTVRGEFYDDADGAISGVSQKMREGTATIELKPLPHLGLKLEGRHDVSTADVFGEGARNVFDGSIARTNRQTLVVLGAVASF